MRWVACFGAGFEVCGGSTASDGFVACRAAVPPSEFEAVASGSVQAGLIPGYNRPCATSSGRLGSFCACSSTAPIAAAPASSDRRTSAMPRRGGAVQLRCDRSIQPSVSAAHTAAATTTIRTSPTAPRMSAPTTTPATPARKSAGRREYARTTAITVHPAAKAVARAAGPFAVPVQMFTSSAHPSTRAPTTPIAIPDMRRAARSDASNAAQATPGSTNKPIAHVVTAPA